MLKHVRYIVIFFSNPQWNFMCYYTLILSPQFTKSTENKTSNQKELKLFFYCRFHTLHTRVPTQKLNEICVYVY
jgi:hypothetical protein